MLFNSSNDFEPEEFVGEVPGLLLPGETGVGLGLGVG
jgi:hypothetical protein